MENITLDHLVKETESLGGYCEHYSCGWCTHEAVKDTLYPCSGTEECPFKLSR